jgi:hypothetical protein
MHKNASGFRRTYHGQVPPVNGHQIDEFDPDRVQEQKVDKTALSHDQQNEPYHEQ